MCSSGNSTTVLCLRQSRKEAAKSSCANLWLNATQCDHRVSHCTSRTDLSEPSSGLSTFMNTATPSTAVLASFT